MELWEIRDELFRIAEETCDNTEILDSEYALKKAEWRDLYGAAIRIEQDKKVPVSLIKDMASTRPEVIQAELEMHKAEARCKENDRRHDYAKWRGKLTDNQIGREWGR